MTNAYFLGILFKAANARSIDLVSASSPPERSAPSLKRHGSRSRGDLPRPLRQPLERLPEAFRRVMLVVLPGWTRRHQSSAADHRQG